MIYYTPTPSGYIINRDDDVIGAIVYPDWTLSLCQGDYTPRELIDIANFILRNK